MTRMRLLNALIRFVASLRAPPLESAFFKPGQRVCLAGRGNEFRLLVLPANQAASILRTANAKALVEGIVSGRVKHIYSARLIAENKITPWRDESKLLAAILAKPSVFKQRLCEFEASRPENGMARAASMSLITFFPKAMAILRDNLDLVDFVAQSQASHCANQVANRSNVPVPFDTPDTLPTFAPAEPKRHSIVFLGHNYYQFKTMAEALRRRGWDALTVSIDPTTGPYNQFNFGEDLNLYHDDPVVRSDKIKTFLWDIPSRFGMVHFYGTHRASFFPEAFDAGEERAIVPWDFAELKRQRVMISYTPCGCFDGARQSSIRKISQNVCKHCMLELQPELCSDKRSAAWAAILDQMCDWIGLEGDWAVDERCGPKYVRGPVVSTLDPDYWSPDLIIDEKKRIPRVPGEIIVYHAVGNIEARRMPGRDLKGSSAVEAAIAKLQAEGISIRLFFATTLHVSEVRYYKAQADIVVDQLNYGRIGANSRESLMLGKPLITRLIPEQQAPLPPLRVIAEAPALNASEETIEAALRKLIADPVLRKSMARRSREFALQWYASDVCAQRFEMVTDRVRNGLPPETDELYPAPLPKNSQLETSLIEPVSAI